MKLTHVSLLAAALIAMVGLSATPASAQRVFVSAQGADGNPCTFAAPCRTFQHAQDTVAAGGEIDVLDPAGYGALAITKAISIQGHGFAGISVGGATGINIIAGASDAINFNGLLIDGGGVGLTGIKFNSGKSLVIENCAVRNMTATGLSFVPSGAIPTSLSVPDSYFADDGSGAAVGPIGAGNIVASFSRVGFYNNAQNGLVIDGAVGTGLVNVAVTDSIAGNGGDGFNVGSAASKATVNLMLTRSTASGNALGVQSSGTTATMLLAQSTVIGNGIGLETLNGGVIQSYGDNYLAANGPNIGSLGSVTKQ